MTEPFILKRLPRNMLKCLENAWKMLAVFGNNDVMHNYRNDKSIVMLYKLTDTTLSNEAVETTSTVCSLTSCTSKSTPG